MNRVSGGHVIVNARVGARVKPFPGAHSLVALYVGRRPYSSGHGIVTASFWTGAYFARRVLLDDRRVTRSAGT